MRIIISPQQGLIFHLPLNLKALSSRATTLPVDLLAFIIFSTMELPITTPPFPPPIFSFPFASSAIGCPPRSFVTLGVRLRSAEADPGLDLVADVALPGATDVIRFGGASVGKSG